MYTAVAVWVSTPVLRCRPPNARRWRALVSPLLCLRHADGTGQGGGWCRRRACASVLVPSPMWGVVPSVSTRQPRPRDSGSYGSWCAVVSHGPSARHQREVSALYWRVVVWKVGGSMCVPNIHTSIAPRPPLLFPSSVICPRSNNLRSLDDALGGGRTTPAHDQRNDLRLRIVPVARSLKRCRVHIHFRGTCCSVISNSTAESDQNCNNTAWE
jgi:hypothetical protein